MKRRRHPTPGRSRTGLDDDALRSYLGMTFMARLEQTPLIIGRDHYTTRQLAAVLGVTNAGAARRLSNVALAIKAKDTRDFYDRTSPTALARLEGVGTTTVYVALQLFVSQGFDGHAWFHYQREGAVMTTFNTIKRHESQAAARTKAGAARRSTGNAAPDSGAASARGM